MAGDNSSNYEDPQEVTVFDKSVNLLNMESKCPVCFQGHDSHTTCAEYERMCQMIICESIPQELPPDVVRCNSRSDTGLEAVQINLSSLRQRFESVSDSDFDHHHNQVNNNHINGDCNHNNNQRNHQPVDLQRFGLSRSESVLLRLKRYQSIVSGEEMSVKNGDVCDGDEIIGNNEEDEVNSCHESKRKEKAIRFAGLSVLKSQWESGIVSENNNNENEENDGNAEGNGQVNKTSRHNHNFVEGENKRNSRSDTGLEAVQINLSSLRQRFESGSDPDSDHHHNQVNNNHINGDCNHNNNQRNHQPVDLQRFGLSRSESVHLRLKRYQSIVSGEGMSIKNGDVCNGDEIIGNNEEDEVNACHESKRKEKAIRFAGLSVLKSQWESGNVSENNENEYEENDGNAEGNAQAHKTSRHNLNLVEGENKSNSRSDTGLEAVQINLSSLRQRFESGSDPDSDHYHNQVNNNHINGDCNHNNNQRNHQPVDLQRFGLSRSESVLLRLKRYQSIVSGEGMSVKNGDVCDGDEIIGNNEEDEVNTCHESKRKEKAIRFAGLSVLKSQWESGIVSENNNNENEENDGNAGGNSNEGDVKEELFKLRQRICLGRSASLKQIYENGGCHGELPPKAFKGEVMTSKVKTISMKEKFEKGQVENNEQEKMKALKREKMTDLSVVVDADTAAREAKKIFKQMDASLSNYSLSA